MAKDPGRIARAMRADDQRLVEKMRAEYHQRMQGRPVPTQDEIDRIKLGEPGVQISPSGAQQLPIHGRQATMLAESGGTPGTSPPPTNDSGSEGHGYVEHAPAAAHVAAAPRAARPAPPAASRPKPE